MGDRNAELSSGRERKGHGAGGQAEERAAEGARGVTARSYTWDLRRYRSWGGSFVSQEGAGMDFLWIGMFGSHLTVLRNHSWQA